MTLEEVIERFTDEKRTAINCVGEDEIILEKRFHDTVVKPFILGYTIAPKSPHAPNGRFIGEYANLEEVRNGLTQLPSAMMGFDTKGWELGQMETRR